MRTYFYACLLISLATSCSSYSPLSDAEIYTAPYRAPQSPGVKVTYFGNTTILVSDGETNLLVDGFFSRPSAVRTLFGKIAPDKDVIDSELENGGITKLNAILIGHSHHDHALDAPYVAQKTGAKVFGNESYGFVHQGAKGKMDKDHLEILRAPKEVHNIGKFKITFVQSCHVTSRRRLQKAVDGDIKKPVVTPAKFSDFKCGKVYAIHIDHPQGSLAITTTAGAKDGQFNGMQADVLLLGLGGFSDESERLKEKYWRNTAGALNPKNIFPVHWDNFGRKLSCGLKPFPKAIDDLETSIEWLKEKQGSENVKAIGLRDSFLIKKTNITVAE